MTTEELKTLQGLLEKWHKSIRPPQATPAQLATVSLVAVRKVWADIDHEINVLNKFDPAWNESPDLPGELHDPDEMSTLLEAFESESA